MASFDSGARREERPTRTARVKDEVIVLLPLIQIACERLRVLVTPCDNRSVYVVIHSVVVNPLLGSWLALTDTGLAVDGMVFGLVAHAITAQVTRRIHDATLWQVIPIEAGLLLEQGM